MEIDQENENDYTAINEVDLSVVYKKKKLYKKSMTKTSKAIEPEEQPKNSYGNLAAILQKALREKFAETSERMMTTMTDASPIFVPIQFYKAFIYHILFMNFGPFCTPLLLCFETRLFLVNVGFLPSCNKMSNIFFMAQTMTFMMWITCIYFYVSDYLEATDDVSLSKPYIAPVVVCGVLQASRYFTIATRHGTTPPNMILALSEKPIVRQSFMEALILYAWLLIKPEAIMNEINTAMVRMQVSPAAFKMKTLSPIYPLYTQKFTDPNHYKNREISLKEAIKEEKLTNQEVKIVMFEFQQRGLF